VTAGDQNIVADTDTAHDQDSLKIMIVTSDRYPPKRPAAKAIFGEEFALRGHRIDWLMQAEDAATTGGTFEFGNGHVYLAATQAGNTRFHRLKKYLLDALNDFRIFRLARMHRYDIIQVKDKYIAGVIGWIAARLYGSKFCFWLAYPHSEANLYSAKHKIARYPLFYWFRGWYQAILLYKFLLPRSDQIFVQSEQMRTDIAAKGISPDLMTPVPGSLNIDTVPFRHNVRVDSRATNILYVGTLIRNRHLDFVIRVFAEVLKLVPGARLQFVGKGSSAEDEDLLHDEIRKLKLDPESVEFVGYVPMQDVWKYIERSAVCLSPYFPSFELCRMSVAVFSEFRTDLYISDETDRVHGNGSSRGGERAPGTVIGHR
jgi:glycosyltransferase involved in cell wall biosynthesis